ncbi:MAG TPA: glycosyltransferase, partial [Polyangiaceae bacterium]|nr:glycosyltransferase [Polyangiaceae bacterium]
MAAAPLFSIVVPTRDRPDFVPLVIDALKAQSFHDFEVIVSDNAVHRPFSPDPATFDGVRFRYVRPPSPVWMCE